MIRRAHSFAWIAVVGTLASAPALADVKVAFIDPLSGGAASTGILAQKTHQFYIDAINAAGGINGEKIQLLSFDNKVNPQESLIQLKKALDDGARFVVQGNGSAVALAITDAVQKHNERNPGKEVLFLNYAAVDPALTNEKCNFWHFRFDADADMKMAAMTDVIAKDQKVKAVYLINQDYSFGKAVAVAARKMLNDKRPDIKIVGDELHPLQKVQDFSPYVAKIKAAGADTVITGNWSNDMVLLIKAGKDAGLKVVWQTYYGGSPGTVTAVGEAGVDTLKQVSEWHKNATPELDATVAAFDKRFPARKTSTRTGARGTCGTCSRRRPRKRARTIP
jgi:branched-chain amino acid transport system substrate-binding protein